jgi:hypothetical protein
MQKGRPLRAGPLKQREAPEKKLPDAPKHEGSLAARSCRTTTPEETTLLATHLTTAFGMLAAMTGTVHGNLLISSE